MITVTHQGQEYEINAVYTGGCLDLIMRADDQAAYDTEAKAVGFMVQDDEGSWKDAWWANISRIGSVVLTPAVLDGETTITPAVIDSRYHVNARLNAETTARGLWIPVAIQWMMQGQDDTEVNASEVGKKRAGVSLIDPETISSPSRVYL
jgi:hypothetical protein